MSRCGECQECCRLLAVEAIKKPAQSKCHQQGSFGCKIYATRPISCARFRCVYVDKRDWDEKMRPDKSGVMIVEYPGKVKAYLLRSDISPEIFAWIEKQNLTGIKIEGVDAR